MSQKFTLWNMPGESWNGVPQNLSVSEDLERKIKEAMTTPASKEDLRPYETPIDQEQMAKIIG